MIITGDNRIELPKLETASVQCCVTSPPYWGLRDYGVAGQIGLESTPETYVKELVGVFAEVWRVLRDDGTLWLNLGDSYASYRDGKATPHSTRNGDAGTLVPKGYAFNRMASTFTGTGIKHKDLVGIPWRVAFALQSFGWYLRSDIIWAKPNPMPESVTDRPTRSHEYIFLLTKKERYFYDYEAVREPASECSMDRISQKSFDRQTGGDKDMKTGNRSMRKTLENWAKSQKQRGHSRRHNGFNDRWDQMEREEQCSGMRNKRDVWTVPPANFKDSHFATFPPDLIKPCILAGTKPGDVVLDPFFGSGTVGQVATELGRNFIGIELNPQYSEMASKRCETTIGLPL